MAIYAALSVFVLGILFMAMGVYGLWTGVMGGRVLNWLLLPGTLVAEMGAMFGSLITGGEARGKLIDGGGKSAPAGQGASGGGTFSGKSAGGASGGAGKGGKFLSVLAAALFAILFCGAGVMAAGHWLGHPVVSQFSGGLHGTSRVELPRALPDSGDAFWTHLDRQLNLLHRMVGTWANVDWTDWRTGVFIYLTLCLALRMAPAPSRPLGATLLAILLSAGLIGLLGAAWKGLAGVIGDIWPLVSFVWTFLLFVLVVSLAVMGVVTLVKGLATSRHL